MPELVGLVVDEGEGCVCVKGAGEPEPIPPAILECHNFYHSVNFYYHPVNLNSQHLQLSRCIVSSTYK